jgi:flagellar basal body-associated protein FliL
MQKIINNKVNKANQSQRTCSNSVIIIIIIIIIIIALQSFVGPWSLF